jgi:hypothetical protein
MKKILLIMFLTFTTMTNADEGRYTMIAEPVNEKGGIWIIDNKRMRQSIAGKVSSKLIALIGIPWINIIKMKRGNISSN